MSKNKSKDGVLDHNPRPKPIPNPPNPGMANFQQKSPPPRKAVTLGQVLGLKLNEKDGSWNITVNVHREKVPASIEQWAFQWVAVAVMDNQAAAEKATGEDWGGLLDDK